jgi:predicted nuclease of restriction endonuclease-like (RecB) superfamily
LPWTHYTLLLAVQSEHARSFSEGEALRGGWTARQLVRQIDSQFYERTALSRDKIAMLRKGQRRRADDQNIPEQEIREPMVLEFLDLKDEYSESDLEEALIRDIETFLLELGSDFAFIGRQLGCGSATSGSVTARERRRALPRQAVAGQRISTRWSPAPHVPVTLTLSSKVNERLARSKSQLGHACAQASGPIGIA